MDENRKKALGMALNQIEKQFGKGTLSVLRTAMQGSCYSARQLLAEVQFAPLFTAICLPSYRLHWPGV